MPIRPDLHIDSRRVILWNLKRLARAGRFHYARKKTVGITRWPDMLCRRLGINYCGRCQTTKTEAVPALGHAPGSWTVTKQPTCIAEGRNVEEVFGG